MIRVSWSKRATHDLVSIAAYLQKEAGFAARGQVERIWDAVQQLTHFPLSGTLFHPKSTGRVLLVPRTPYLVYYRFQDDMIMISAIRHGAQTPLMRFPI